MSTYTVKMLVDGAPVGGAASVTREVLWDMVRSEECSDHPAQCDTKCDSFTFMSDLGVRDQAVMVTRELVFPTDKKVTTSVVIAYRNEG